MSVFAGATSLSKSAASLAERVDPVLGEQISTEGENGRIYSL